MKVHQVTAIVVAALVAGTASTSSAQSLTQIGKPTTTTAIGQPIEFPEPAEISSYIADVPVGTFEFHKHPYQRIFYVLAGTLTVEEESGHKTDYPAGSLVIEMRNVVHRPVNNGPEPAKVLVLDISKPGERNQLAP